MTVTYRIDSDVFTPYGWLQFDPQPLEERPNYCKQIFTTVYLLHHEFPGLFSPLLTYSCSFLFFCTSPTSPSQNRTETFQTKPITSQWPSRAVSARPWNEWSVTDWFGSLNLKKNKLIYKFNN